MVIFPLPILTRKNWDHWSTQMKVLFRYQETSDTVESGCFAGSGTSHKATTKKEERQ